MTHEDPPIYADEFVHMGVESMTGPGWIIYDDRDPGNEPDECDAYGLWNRIRASLAELDKLKREAGSA